MNKRYLKWLLPVGLFAFLLSQILSRPELRGLFSADYWVNWWRYGQVIRLVEAEYVHADDVNFRAFTDVALQGAVGALDGYSDYMTPVDYEEFNMAANQEYVGVGIEIAEFAGRVVVAQVFPQGSAQLVGMRPGDCIVAVDGDDVKGDTFRDISSRIRGESGSWVRLTVERSGVAGAVDFNLERRAIALAAVADVELMPSKVGYLKLRQFTDSADREMSAAIEQLQREGMLGLLLDLRGNPGGRLMVAANIAELFLHHGQRILSVESRRGEADIIEAAEVDGGYFGPLVVLIDGASASASEVLAGALRDHHRAVLVGARSYGKGSVQSVYQFRSGEALKLTTARYLLPEGEAINGSGVQPDIEVEVADRDRVLLLLQQHHSRTMDDETFEQCFGFKPVDDVQLESALETILAIISVSPAQASSRRCVDRKTFLND